MSDAAGLIVLPGDPRRELDPAAASVEAPQHELETLAIDAFGWIHSPTCSSDRALQVVANRLLQRYAVKIWFANVDGGKT